MEDPIKKAFSKVKEEIDSLKSDITQIKNLLRNIEDELTTTKLHNLADEPYLGTTYHPKNNLKNTSTVRQMNTTDPATSTDNTTVRQEIGGLKTLNLGISIGNRGASTDRQTDRQTDTSTDNHQKNIENNIQNIETDIHEASEILESLDRLKKEIRLKFKRVTTQEMAVFSAIYQLEEQDPKSSTYPKIASKLDLSESSIRDYVQRMINKGIPIKKHKINNKKILLSISSELKKIATLQTILRLIEL